MYLLDLLQESRSMRKINKFLRKNYFLKLPKFAEIMGTSNVKDAVTCGAGLAAHEPGAQEPPTNRDELEKEETLGATQGVGDRGDPEVQVSSHGDAQKSKTSKKDGAGDSQTRSGPALAEVLASGDEEILLNSEEGEAWRPDADARRGGVRGREEAVPENRVGNISEKQEARSRSLKAGGLSWLRKKGGGIPQLRGRGQ